MKTGWESVAKLAQGIFLPFINLPRPTTADDAILEIVTEDAFLEIETECTINEDAIL